MVILNIDLTYLVRMDVLWRSILVKIWRVNLYANQGSDLDAIQHARIFHDNQWKAAFSTYFNETGIHMIQKCFLFALET